MSMSEDLHPRTIYILQKTPLLVQLTAAVESALLPETTYMYVSVTSFLPRYSELTIRYLVLARLEPRLSTSVDGCSHM